jgi:crotonobetainyl-CoA:carnitine CoA-transferase CaiB-like acyl-CoA transferase
MNDRVTGGVGESPYTGLTVIELATDTAGEQLGQLMSLMGADVVKIEPPGGAPSRAVGPFVGDTPDPEGSLNFWFYNRGKRSAVLDLADAGHRETLHGLLDTADVVITSMSAAQSAAVELSAESLGERYPQLIVASLSPFGLTGPWAEYVTSELVSMAAGGPLMSCGYDDHSIPPILPGGEQASHTAGAFGHIAVLLALIERRRTGLGQIIDLSVHESNAVNGELANPYWFYPRVNVQRQTCRHAQPTRTQPALFQCGDGRYVYFALILADPKPWAALVNWLAEKGMEADLREPEYDTIKYRQEQFPHIQGLVEVFFLLTDAETAYLEGQQRELPVGILNAPEDLFLDEHLKAREFFVDVPVDGVGDVPFPGAPFRFTAFRPADPGPAPHLGHDTDDVLGAVR